MERSTNFLGNLKKCIECTESSNCHNHSCGYIMESIAKLRDYEDLEEQGKMLRLPVAVGDMVHVINKGEIAKAKVYDIQFRGTKYKEGQRFWMNIGANVYFEQDFEKTVFYTLEAAEAKLREMGTRNDNKGTVRGSGERGAEDYMIRLQYQDGGGCYDGSCLKLILFDSRSGETITLETLKLRNDLNYHTYLADDVAIKALQEIRQYRSIGTPDECRAAVEKQRAKKPKVENDNGKERKCCSECGCFFNPTSNYCPKCGLRILREDEND